MKKTTRNILLALALALLLALSGLAGSLLYLYNHPLLVKSFLEKALSSTSGASLSIEELSYSLDPANITLRGIHLGPGTKLRGLQLDVSLLSTGLHLKGPLGRRRLILRDLHIQDPVLSFTRELTLPSNAAPEAPAEGTFPGILKTAVNYLLFSEIELQSADLSNGKVSGHMEDLVVTLSDIRGGLTRPDGVQVSFATALEIPSRRIRFYSENLKLTAERVLSLKDPEIPCKLRFRGGTIQASSFKTTALQCDAGLTYLAGKKVLKFITFDLKGKLIPPDGTIPHPASPLDFQVGAQGTLNLENFSADLSPLSVAFPGIVSLEGDMRTSPGPGTELWFRIRQGRLHPERLLRLLPPGLMGKDSAVNLSGTVTFKGELRGLRNGETWQTTYDLAILLQKNPFSFRYGTRGVAGEITSRLRAKGRFPGLEAGGRLEIQGARLSGMPVRAEGISCGLSFWWETPRLRIKKLHLHSPRVSMEVAGTAVPVSDLVLNVPEADLNTHKMEVRIPGATLRSSLFHNLSLDFTSEKDRFHLTLKGEETGLLGTLRELALLPAGWRLEAKDRLDLSLARGADGEWSAGARIGLRGLAAENPDGSAAGEGLLMDLTLTGRIRPDLSGIQWETTLAVTEGECLIEPFYFNLGRNPFEARCRGAYEVPMEKLDLQGLDLELKGLLGIKITGKLRGRPPSTAGHLNLRISKTPLQPVFRDLVADPFGAAHPLLSTLKVSGDLSGDMDLSFREGLREIKGRIGWHRGSLTLKERDIEISGLDLDLPLWGRWDSADSGEEPLSGRCRIQSLSLPLLPEQPLDLTLAAHPNRLAVQRPFSIAIPGGEVEIGPLLCRRLFTSRPVLETSLTFENIALDPILSRIWPEETRGSARARLDPILLSGDSITTRGEVRADVFGGTVHISNLGVSGIGTPTPLFRADAEWDDLHLGDLTRGTSFGKIEGILRGSIKDLEIAFGQPQRFELELETIKRPGVPQKISVKAVENIAEIGGGRSPFMGLAGVFTSFFKEFPYKKIGIRASLKNDVFRVNGTIKEKGREYLVKRGGFSGVNVVNQNPDNRIRFKDMMERIKRIMKSRKGPVIR
ncbi:MAG: hypothetical protein JRJ01_04730 [Deltaproteobacteria bacterium]|nr:hypothetical protein [Deltaproteobacteria bacterium]